MLKIFQMAQSIRLPELKDVSLVELLRSAAREAGWYLEYDPKIQNKTKFRVRYQKPFSDVVTAELVCRMQKDIMVFLKKRDIDPTLIDSYVGYGFFNFIKTYKPDVLDTEEKIKAAVIQSVRCKVDQGQRKEIFRYNPAYLNRDHDDGTKKKHKYIDTCREVSMNSPINGKDGDQAAELGDFIPDDETSPLEALLNKEEIGSLADQFCGTVAQKVFIEILITGGGSGKVSPRTLKAEALNYHTVVEEAASEIGITLDEGYSVDDLPDEVVNRVGRKVKTFYRGLRKKLMSRLGNNLYTEEDV